MRINYLLFIIFLFISCSTNQEMDKNLYNSITERLEGSNSTLIKNTKKLSIYIPTNKHGFKFNQQKYFYEEKKIIDSLFDTRISKLVELNMQLSENHLSKEMFIKKINSIEEDLLIFERKLEKRVHKLYKINYFKDRSTKDILSEKNVLLKKINFVDNGFILKNYNSGNIKLMKIAIDLTISKLLQIKFNYLEHLSYYVSPSSLPGCYFGIYPLVLPRQNFVKRGEPFKAAIGISPYEFEFDPNDIKLSVDDEILKYNKNKGVFGDYVSKPIQSKKKIIKITCEIRNPITNNWKVAFKNKKYIINTVK